MKSNLLKLLTSICLILALVFSLSACGGGSEAPAEEAAPEEVTEEAVTEEEVAEEAPKDVLAGNTYEFTSGEIEVSEGEFQKLAEPGENVPKFEFGEDGTYVETTFEPDFESGDFETTYETKYTGTYSVDGNNVTITRDPVDGKPDTAAELLNYTYTIEGDTLVISRPFEQKEDTTYPGQKVVYTKVQ